MAKPSNFRLRNMWFQVHLWLGVGLCLLVVPVCVTGAYEVWQEEIDAAFHPARFAVTAGPALGPAAYSASAQTAFGDRARVSAVRVPAKPGEPALVTGVMGRPGGEGREGAQGEGAPRPPATAGPQRRPTLTAWVDPASAKVLDVADQSKSFRQTMHRLHGSLLITGGNGRKIVGWLGWALLTSALTGIWLWTPRAGALAKGFRYRRTGSTLMNLHYLTGFWISIPLAILALTGALISFPQTTRALVGAVAPLTPQPARPGGGGPGGGGGPVRDAALSIDQAAGLAEAAVPNASLQTVNLPTRSPEGSVWRVQLQPLQGAPITVTVADATGAAEVQAARPVLAGDAALRWNRRIHDGDDTGVVWKAIITLAGLLPALLGVTGVILWARRQLRKLALRGEDPVPAAVAE